MPQYETYDVVILGSGPAGLQAAIHAARKRVRVLVLGRTEKSSLFHAHIENICCVFNVAGEEMLKVGREQAALFGAEMAGEDVLGLTQDAAGFRVRLEGGQEIVGKSLILATGTSRHRLNVDGERALLGKGVSYCVDCDGNFFRQQPVCIVGGESAAADGALSLIKIASAVHLVCEKLSVSPAMMAELDASDVTVHTGEAIAAIMGDTAVTGVRLRGGAALSVKGVFIELGAKGVMELAASLGLMMDDEMKFLQTDKQQATTVPGVFAAGDICGPPWQMAKAIGEGCVAGINAASYAKKQNADIHKAEE
ncbi:MAG: FAD-dependent oxidoreductase [Pseudomonadota bacterium]